ncbi:Gfo/Idh/MocA family protein [Alicyclobacillus macrosporangiidus]|uniref:Predicted dehydrogenase n=1 Tax=Alicyclobacillus macrosporangiidus TaxID=392015 RepID=A0A1I7KX15_9BACL|nr:Gfo/Idh/MocA family oxidoreductase [Alicyclobacillus macrosporangiidus]SFV01970.1 Predicted dehydrogenase [Alicyclobacillus macrosporangiidus]
MKTLVIGFGSIGQRHCRILLELGCRVAVVSCQDSIPFPVYRTMAEALQEFKPEYVVIANRTSEHCDTLAGLLAIGHDGPILVEKPLFDKPHHLPLHQQKVFVGYNLRFHPVLHQLKQRLRSQSVISVQVYAGQYLPAWRPGDYRDCYSARRAKGGGVLRDLSHELDYTQWLFGTWTRVVAVGGHYSHLEIDSEDAVSLLMSTNDCPIVNIQMNYLDRARRREILINTDAHTYRADLVQNTLQTDDCTETYPCDLDATYLAQHQALLAGDFTTLCSVAEAQETLNLILNAEQSIIEGGWMIR